MSFQQNFGLHDLAAEFDLHVVSYICIVVELLF